MTSKEALRDELVAILTATLAAARTAHAAAHEGATHPEARSENPKDTRGLEQSYIARGQAQRVAELEVAVAELVKLELRAFRDADPIAMTALVDLTAGETTRRYFVAPHGGGSVLAGAIHVITPASPIGAALAGRRNGDLVEVALGGKLRELEIVGIE